MDNRIPDTPEYREGMKAARKGTIIPPAYLGTYKAHRWQEGFKAGGVVIAQEGEAALRSHAEKLRKAGLA